MITAQLTVPDNSSNNNGYISKNNNNFEQHCDINDLSSINNDYNVNNKCFSIMHVNIRSVQRNLHRLKDLLCKENLYPDLIALSETWHDKNSFFIPSIPNYDFVFSKHSCNKAGGVAIFIKSSFDFSVRSDISVSADRCEDLWIEIEDQHRGSNIFGVIYIHPGSGVLDFQEKFEEIIIQLNVSKKPIFITGDFNIDCYKEKNDTYINSIASLGFQQLVNSPTRFCPINNSFSIIDHFYTNQPIDNVNTKVLVHDVSDHFPILAWIEKMSIKKSHPKINTKRDMKSFKKEAFVRDMKLELGSIFIEGNASTVFDQFKNKFMKVVEIHAPLRKVSRREVKLKQKPWITNKLIRLIKKKDKLYKNSIKTRRVNDIRKYKTFSKELNKSIGKSKRNHYNKLVRRSTKSSKLIWKQVNEIVQLKGKKTNQILHVQGSDGSEIYNPQQISESFNQFFVSIGKKLSSSFSPSSCETPSFSSQTRSFFLKPLTVADVFSQIKQLDCSKSVRPCDPPIKLIKISNEVLSPILTKIFNYCIDNKIYPLDLKKACVIPIYKKGKKNLCSNYRPISLISPFSKIFEKCILSQLNDFFTKNELLSKRQFGF